MINLAFLAAAAVAAPTYRCTDANGTTTYSETICASGAKCLRFDRNKWSESACDEARNPKPEGFRGDWRDPCRNDLKCWTDKAGRKPYRLCEERVEASAKYQLRWEDGWLESKTGLIGWANKNLGTINIGGNKVSLQNGFGAWQGMAYICTYDTISERIADFAIAPR